jgi:hypothetical protein
MPKCRSCGTRLSKFDKDICPVCGIDMPLEGVDNETIEITSEISGLKETMSGYKETSRTTCFVLSLCIGWSGASYFYQGKNKLGIIWLILNVTIFASLFLLFYFLNQFLLAYILPISLIYILNILMSFYFMYKEDYKDGRGNFLK